jgi:hypothetical protein
MWPMYVADNNIRRRKFYSLPKRNNKIRRFELTCDIEIVSANSTVISDERPLLETSNLISSLA